MGGTQIKDSPSLPQLTRSTDTVANRTRPEGPLTSIEGPLTSIEGPLTSSEGPSAAHEFPALERNAVVASSADATSHASRAAAAAAASAALAQNPPSSGGLPRNSWSLFEYTLSAVGQDDDRIIAATAAGPALQVESAALRQRLRDDASLYVLAAMANCLQDRHVLRITYSPKYSDAAFEYRVVTLPLDHPYLQLPPNVLRAFASGASAAHFLAAASSASAQRFGSSEGRALRSPPNFEGSRSLERGNPTRRIRTGALLSLPSLTGSSSQSVEASSVASSSASASPEEAARAGQPIPSSERSSERSLLSAAVADAAREARRAETAASAVPLSAAVASLLSEKCVLLPEPAWRSLGIRMSRGWVNIGNGVHEAHCLLFARPLETDGVFGVASAEAVAKAEASMKTRRTGCLRLVALGRLLSQRELLCLQQLIEAFAAASAVGASGSRPRRRRPLKLGLSFRSSSPFPYPSHGSLRRRAVSPDPLFCSASSSPFFSPRERQTNSRCRRAGADESCRGWQSLAAFCENFFGISSPTCLPSSSREEAGSSYTRRRRTQCSFRRVSRESPPPHFPSGGAAVEQRLRQTLDFLHSSLAAKQRREGTKPLWRTKARRLGVHLREAKEPASREGCLSVIESLQQLSPAPGGFERFVIELRPLKACEVNAGLASQETQRALRVDRSEDQADCPAEQGEPSHFHEAFEETIRSAFREAQKDAPTKVVPLTLALLLRLIREKNLLDSKELLGSSVVVLGSGETAIRKGTVAAVDEGSGAALLNLKKGEGLAAARCEEVFWCLDT